MDLSGLWIRLSGLMLVRYQGPYTPLKGTRRVLVLSRMFTCKSQPTPLDVQSAGGYARLAAEFAPMVWVRL